MFRRVITPSAKRSLRRLPRDVQHETLRASEILQHDPYAEERLHGSLSFLFSLHIKYNNVHYRVAYTIDEEQKLVIVH